MNSSLCPYGNDCTHIHPLSYHWQQGSQKICTKQTPLTSLIPILKARWHFRPWRRRHSDCGRARPPSWLQQAAGDGTSTEQRAQQLSDTFCFPQQTIFSQTVKWLFLATAFLFLDLAPMTVWRRIYSTGSFKEISGRVFGTSFPLRKRDWVSFCITIDFKLMLMELWRFWSGPGLVGENPTPRENPHFPEEISSFTTHDQVIKGNPSKEINVREMRFLKTLVVQPHPHLKQFDLMSLTSSSLSKTSRQCGITEGSSWWGPGQPRCLLRAGCLWSVILC